MQNSGRSNVSLLQSLLKQAPPGVFGGKDQAGKASELQANATAVQMQNTHISPRQPEAWANYLQMVGPFHREFNRSASICCRKPYTILNAVFERMASVERLYI